MSQKDHMIADVVLGGTQYGVLFYHLGKQTFAAEAVARGVGVFLSQPIDATADLLSWKSLSWDCVQPAQTRVYGYVRSASTEGMVEQASWEGPLLNAGGNSLAQKGRYMQIMLALYTYYDRPSKTLWTPVVNSLRASYYLSANEDKFYTKKFELGFRPKHVLLTYNGEIPQDGLVRFAIAGTDTTDPLDYQIVAPNTIEELDGISELSDGFKVMIGGVGSTEVPFTIDEVSVVVSGDGQTKINKT